MSVTESEPIFDLQDSGSKHGLKPPAIDLASAEFNALFKQVLGHDHHSDNSFQISDDGKDKVSQGNAASDKNGDSALAFCSIEDRAISDERRARGIEALGPRIMEHLNDQDWLIEHQSELRRAVDRAWMAVGMSEFKTFMDEIQVRSGGNLYCTRGNGILGSINPLNPPGDQVFNVYLRRGLLVPDTNLFDSRRSTHCSA